MLPKKTGCSPSWVGHVLLLLEAVELGVALHAVADNKQGRLDLDFVKRKGGEFSSQEEGVICAHRVNKESYNRHVSAKCMIF
jgi:hypothetical protein